MHRGFAYVRDTDTRRATDLQANHAIKAPDCDPPYLPASLLSRRKNRLFIRARIHARMIVPRVKPTATLSPLSANRTTRVDEIYSLSFSSPKPVDRPFQEYAILVNV